MPEITNEELWELFTGRSEPSDCFKNGRWLHLTLEDKQGIIEVIKKAVTIIPNKKRRDTYLLRLMWIRESIFEMPPLHKDQLLAFFVSAFTLAGGRIDKYGIRDEFNRLL